MTAVEEDPGMEIVHAHHVAPALVPMDVDEAREAMDLYQRMSHALIGPGDMQDIGSSKFPKRSAFQKLANAYRVSTEIVRDETDYDDEGRMIRARVTVRATHPDGRYQEADGRCHILERGERKASDPKTEHDVHGTAVTRAKNRAIGDLIAFGAVSAEEAESTVGGSGPAAATPPPMPGWAAPMSTEAIPLVAENLTRVLKAMDVDGAGARANAIGQEIFDLCDGSFPHALARLAQLLAREPEKTEPYTEDEQAVDGDVVDQINDEQEEGDA